MGKDGKHKKKKHKKEKSRKRERSSSGSGSDSEEERRRIKAEKKARKVEEYWSKQASKGGPAKFVWGKKIERDLMAGKDVREFTAAATQRKHEERMAEIEKVQKRREEKELEKERMEEELALLQRQRLAAEAVEQEQKEEEFHLQQAQVRASRRIAQGRAKPIDWLVQDLYGVGADEEAAAQARRNDEAEESEEEREELRRQVEGDAWTAEARRGGRGREPRDAGGAYGRPRGMAAEPYQALAGLTQEELLELHDEVKGYQELESRVTPLNAEYWGCLLALASHELEALQLEADRRARGEVGAGPVSLGPPVVRAVGAPLAGHGAGGVHSAVQRDIEALLSGQTYGQLTAMETDIQRQLAAGEGDPEYWEAVLPRLKIHACKARLREIKAQMLEERLAAQEGKLDVAAAMGWLDEAEAEATAAERHLGDAGVAFPQGAARIVAEGEDIPLSDSDADEAAGAQQQGKQQQPGQQQPQRRQLHPDEELEQQMAEEEPDAQHGGEGTSAVGASARLPLAALAASDGRFSPPPVDPDELSRGDAAVVHEDEDARMLELLRAQVRIREAERFMSAADIAARGGGGAARGPANQLLDPKNRFRGTASGSHAMMRSLTGESVETGVGRHLPQPQQEAVDAQTQRFREQAARTMGMDEGDRNFGVEVPLEAQVYWWHNRYAPRKPKYFNRIHTGYEWNKYNQTHYDHENPPPKVVQGYKFNIFYPDLIDKTKAPTYRVEPDPAGGKDTAILVFSAGPPYEDIAFRIVNKEWETTHRRGFKCTFDRGILHLYFNFTRARYRR
ncbi:hypothetical protein HT031_000800 [Scenedesmus sp. PABB004]|nr:hypothetical protein HT031_000800 [Scenedesmus sp. PABB004]